MSISISSSSRNHTRVRQGEDRGRHSPFRLLARDPPHDFSSTRRLYRYNPPVMTNLAMKKYARRRRPKYTHSHPKHTHKTSTHKLTLHHTKHEAGSINYG